MKNKTTILRKMTSLLLVIAMIFSVFTTLNIETAQAATKKISFGKYYNLSIPNGRPYDCSIYAPSDYGCIKLDALVRYGETFKIELINSRGSIVDEIYTSYDSEISNKEYIFKEVPKGTYKIRFRYNMDSDNNMSRILKCRVYCKYEPSLKLQDAKNYLYITESSDGRTITFKLKKSLKNAYFEVESFSEDGNKTYNLVRKNSKATVTRDDTIVTPGFTSSVTLTLVQKIGSKKFKSVPLNF